MNPYRWPPSPCISVILVAHAARKRFFILVQKWHLLNLNGRDGCDFCGIIWSFHTKINCLLALACDFSLLNHHPIGFSLNRAEQCLASRLSKFTIIKLSRQSRKNIRYCISLCACGQPKHDTQTWCGHSYSKSPLSFQHGTRWYSCGCNRVVVLRMLDTYFKFWK